ncbi:PA2169 family four-helix-bundle protein [Roseimicrobium sp. ORNL1]|uniref:ferritin-like domain-containing protein n=1 Tax=Roseimicrobium sp. ORNL1 TaxID=2711231 RepID=UPI0013E1D28E|nr:PA2169 family four-helix-bundle protein [Roseimicrobium sp. ORNL1]QIF00499.1 PA2169 family four-helix-bundle protein [Roseimicrobium sp. ORNL1]
MSTTLKELQQTLADGVEGFTKAAESVKDPGLKTLFSGFAAEREEMAHELKEYAHAESEEDSSITGALHRGWINLKGTLTSGDDHAILAECERGEDHALEVFREDLDDDVPPEALSTISSISTRILAVHNKVKELRDSSKAA